MQSAGLAMFTVGHSNKSFDLFVELLAKHAVEVIVDVRSHPFSKYSTQFDMDSIKPSLEKAGLKYLYMGKELGGMPRDERLLNDEGHADYAKVARSAAFQDGITRVLNGSKKFRIALMCAEENPAGCHRRKLIAPVLFQHGVELKHIRADGRFQVESDLLAEESKNDDVGAQQLTLF